LRLLVLFREGTSVKQLEREAERKQQMTELSGLSIQVEQARKDYEKAKAKFKTDSFQFKTKIRTELNAIEPRILADLETTRDLFQQILDKKQLPENNDDLCRLKELILKRQLRGLKDIANHPLVVEQSAIAPL
jgi:hypothetical protein